MNKLTEEQFLARCRTAYAMFGSKLDIILPDMMRVIDAVARLEGGQPREFAELMRDDLERTKTFGMVLASDWQRYAGIQVLAALTHKCQKCAEDPQEWHTRPAYCKHKK